jgi:hypothetical protein
MHTIVAVTLSVVGGAIFVAAMTHLTLTAMPPEWGRSFRARLTSLFLAIIGLVIGVAVPLIFG